MDLAAVASVLMLLAGSLLPSAAHGAPAYNGSMIHSDPYAGVIQGAVVTLSSEGVPEAEVRVLSTGLRAITSRDGRFSIRDVPMGEYSLEIEAPGWEMERRNHVSVLAGQTVELTVMMTRGSRSAVGDSVPATPASWASLYFQESAASRFVDPPPSATRRYTGSLTARAGGSKPSTDPEEGLQAAELRLLAAPAARLRALLFADWIDQGQAPSAQPQIDWLRTANVTGNGNLERRSWRIRPHLSYLSGTSSRIWAEGLYEDLTTSRYAHPWTRDGWVETFFDTTSTGEIALRHGRYAETRVDSTYGWYSAQEHMPEESQQHWTAHLGGEQIIPGGARLGVRLIAEQTKFDERVGTKNAWEYEGNQRDYFFNYTDRTSEPYYVLTGDFPRLAEGTTRTLSAEASFRHGYGVRSTELDLRFQSRDVRFLSVENPAYTNALGEIGTRNDYHRIHPHFSATGRKSFGQKDWAIHLGLGLDAFRPLELVPIDPGDGDLTLAWSPGFDLRFTPLPDAEISARYRHGARVPTPAYPLIFRNSGYATLIADPGLEPETVDTYAVELRKRIGPATASLTGSAVEVSGIFSIIPGFLSPSRFVNSENSTTTRAVELELAPRRLEHLGGSVSYRFARAELNGKHADEANVAWPLDWDVTHRFRLSADFGEPGRWGAQLTWLRESGRPFAPQFRNAHPDDQAARSSRRLPWTGSLDLEAVRIFRTGGHELRLLFEAFNLFDTRNVSDISPQVLPQAPGFADNTYDIYYTETGDAGGAYLGRDTNGDGVGDWVPVHDPRGFGRPRAVRAGVSVVI